MIFVRYLYFYEFAKLNLTTIFSVFLLIILGGSPYILVLEMKFCVPHNDFSSWSRHFWVWVVKDEMFQMVAFTKCKGFKTKDQPGNEFQKSTFFGKTCTDSNTTPYWNTEWFWCKIITNTCVGSFDSISDGKRVGFCTFQRSNG